MKYKHINIIIIITFLALLSFIFYLYFYLDIYKSGFQNYNNVKWSPDLIKRFNIYQTKINKNTVQFDLGILQNQASPEEAEEYLKTGLWNWPDYLKDLYIEAILSSPIIKMDPQIAVNYARSIYNKNAVTELLAWNTKEGNFLLYGRQIKPNGSFKCTYDNNPVMQKRTAVGMDLWNGYTNYKIENLKPEDIPKNISGFSFVNSPCNPCSVFNEGSSNNCPFRLNVDGDDNISTIWKKIWKL